MLALVYTRLSIKYIYHAQHKQCCMGSRKPERTPVMHVTGLVSWTSWRNVPPIPSPTTQVCIHTHTQVYIHTHTHTGKKSSSQDYHKPQGLFTLLILCTYTGEKWRQQAFSSGPHLCLLIHTIDILRSVPFHTALGSYRRT